MKEDKIKKKKSIKINFCLYLFGNKFVLTVFIKVIDNFVLTIPTLVLNQFNLHISKY